MPNSLRTKLSKLRHKCQITNEEYQGLIAKLDGHDERVRADERRKVTEWLREVTTFDCRYCQLLSDCYEEKYKGCVERLIAEYEKEQMNV